jgi:hypothetical protein
VRAPSPAPAIPETAPSALHRGGLHKFRAAAVAAVEDHV